MTRLLISLGLLGLIVCLAAVPAQACQTRKHEIAGSFIDRIENADAVAIVEPLTAGGKRVGGEELDDGTIKEFGGEPVDHRFAVRETLFGDLPAEIGIDDIDFVNDPDADDPVVTCHPVPTRGERALAILIKTETGGWKLYPRFTYGSYFEHRETKPEFNEMTPERLAWAREIIRVRSKNPRERLAHWRDLAAEFAGYKSAQDAPLRVREAALHLNMITPDKPGFFLKETYDALIKGLAAPYTVAMPPGAGRDLDWNNVVLEPGGVRSEHILRDVPQWLLYAMRLGKHPEGVTAAEEALRAQRIAAGSLSEHVALLLEAGRPQDAFSLFRRHAALSLSEDRSLGEAEILGAASRLIRHKTPAGTPFWQSDPAWQAVLPRMAADLIYRAWDLEPIYFEEWQDELVALQSLWRNDPRTDVQGALSLARIGDARPVDWARAEHKRLRRMTDNPGHIDFVVPLWIAVIANGAPAERFRRELACGDETDRLLAARYLLMMYSPRRRRATFISLLVAGAEDKILRTVLAESLTAHVALPMVEQDWAAFKGEFFSGGDVTSVGYLHDERVLRLVADLYYGDKPIEPSDYGLPEETCP